MTDIVFSSEVMLLGWRETHSGGATVTFLLADPSDLEPFKRMTVAKGKVAGQRMACVLAQIDDNDTPPREQDAAGSQAVNGDESTATPGNGEVESRAPNELARKLHVSGYFRSPKLWLAMHDHGGYTAQDHFKWLMTRRCYMPTDRVICFGDECVHHCNAASAIDGGKRQPEHPQKPLHYWGLKLCHNHHQWVHSKDATREDKELLLQSAVELTAERMKAQLKAIVGIESLREITQDMLDAFEERIGL